MSKNILQTLSGFPSYDEIRVVDPLRHVEKKLKDENINVQFINLEEITLPIASKYDVVCFHGAFSINTMNLLRKIPFCMFVDDLMWDIPPGNPAIVSSVQKSCLWWAFDNAKSIVTTTERLKKSIKHEGKTLIAPNLIDHIAPENKSNRVCYSAGNSHGADIELLNEINRELIIFGPCLPSNFSRYERNKYGGVDIKPTKNIGWVKLQMEYERYQIWMKNLNFGVGLCPLLNNEFNWSKSIWKFLEYLREGAVSVVSDLLPYSEIPDNCVVKVKNNWNLAIKDAFARHEEIYNNAVKWVKDNYSDYNVWLDVYRCI